MTKKIWEFTNEEMDALVSDAAKKAVTETHEAGRPSTHGDEKGVYHLYQDGRKEHIK